MRTDEPVKSLVFLLIQIILNWLGFTFYKMQIDVENMLWQILYSNKPGEKIWCGGPIHQISTYTKGKGSGVVREISLIYVKG